MKIQEIPLWSDPGITSHLTVCSSFSDVFFCFGYKLNKKYAIRRIKKTIFAPIYTINLIFYEQEVSTSTALCAIARMAIGRQHPCGTSTKPCFGFLQIPCTNPQCFAPTTIGMGWRRSRYT